MLNVALAFGEGDLVATQVTYDIRYYKTNEPLSAITRTGLNATRYVIEETDPATEYTIELTAHAFRFLSSATANTVTMTQKLPLPSAGSATIVLIATENGVEIDWVAVPLLINRFDIGIETVPVQ